MHYLVTGHTGFKGAWLTLLLRSRGHIVSGISLDPEPGSLFESAALAELMENDFRLDIRDAEATAAAIKALRPDVVLHLAAQPLVRESYRNPRWTIETNVMGTLNLLEAVSNVPSIRANVVVTTDKVYRNVNQIAGYVENDPLGGKDPYSASKAMADVLTASWVASFPVCPTAVARAGNVIGGGDVAADRLLPDLLRSFASRVPAQIRYPNAVRPWQHVLDCLTGYLSLVDALLAGSGQGAWNFGPDPSSFVTVGAVADKVADLWGEGARWETPGLDEPDEAHLLTLDSTRAHDQLQWRNALDLEAALAWTVMWTKEVASGRAAREVTLQQIQAMADNN